MIEGREGERYKREEMKFNGNASYPLHRSDHVRDLERMTEDLGIRERNLKCCTTGSGKRFIQIKGSVDPLTDETLDLFRRSPLPPKQTGHVPRKEVTETLLFGKRKMN